jgi:phosphoserine aminotransferase
MMVHNFNAGPSILPSEVFQHASESLLNFNNSGLSILEIGHRTEMFEGVMNEARSLIKELMQLDADHEVLFLHGGASTQFMQVPMNLLEDNKTAAYIDNGIWGAKAIKEAKLFGNVEVVASSKDKNHTYLPKILQCLLKLCTFIIPPTILLKEHNGIRYQKQTFRWLLI